MRDEASQALRLNGNTFNNSNGTVEKLKNIAPILRRIEKVPVLFGSAALELRGSSVFFAFFINVLFVLVVITVHFLVSMVYLDCEVLP